MLLYIFKTSNENQGEVLFQTYNPKLYSLHFDRQHYTLRFWAMQMRQRKNLSVTPFLHLSLILCSSLREARPEKLGTGL